MAPIAGQFVWTAVYFAFAAVRSCQRGTMVPTFLRLLQHCGKLLRVLPRDVLDHCRASARSARRPRFRHVDEDSQGLLCQVAQTIHQERSPGSPLGKTPQSQNSSNSTDPKMSPQTVSRLRVSRPFEALQGLIEPNCAVTVDFQRLALQSCFGGKLSLYLFKL